MNTNTPAEHTPPNIVAALAVLNRQFCSASKRKTIRQKVMSARRKMYRAHAQARAALAAAKL